MEEMRVKDFAGHRDQRWGHISYAQHGDDFMILNLFEMIGKDKPSYLDLGAHHPLFISNTALLYERGSRGVNIEANPNLIAEFKRLRPHDVTVNVGVGPHEGKLPFYVYDFTSGRNTFSKAEVERNADKMTVQYTVDIEVKTLTQIVKEYCGGVMPDLLSVDLEGLDYDVLASYDFKKSAPKVICVETRANEIQKMRDLLDLRGFVLYCRMGENLFFVHENYLDLVM